MTEKQVERKSDAAHGPSLSISPPKRIAEWIPALSFGFVLISAILTGAYQFRELESRVDELLPEAVAAAEAKAREVLQSEAGNVLFGPIGKEQLLKLPDDGSLGELVLDTARKEGICFLTRIKGNIFDHSRGRENVRMVMVGDS